MEKLRVHRVTNCVSMTTKVFYIRKLMQQAWSTTQLHLKTQWLTTNCSVQHTRKVLQPFSINTLSKKQWFDFNKNRPIHSFNGFRIDYKTHKENGNFCWQPIENSMVLYLKQPWLWFRNLNSTNQSDQKLSTAVELLFSIWQLCSLFFPLMIVYPI